MILATFMHNHITCEINFQKILINMLRSLWGFPNVLTKVSLNVIQLA